MRGRGALLAMVVAGIAGGGCGKRSDNGFAVALTVVIDSSISDAELGQTRSLHLTVTGAETYSHTFAVGSELAGREGRILYRPGAQSGQLNFGVTLGDAQDTLIGGGTVTGVVLVPGATAAATVHVGHEVSDLGPTDDLTGSDGTVLADMAMPQDLRGVDLLGADLSVPPPDLKPPPDLRGADLPLVLDQAVPDLVVKPDLTAPPDMTVVPLFNKPVLVPVANGPTAIATADFNSDGRVDLVVTNTANVSVQTLLYDKVFNVFVSQPTTFVLLPQPDVIVAGVFGTNDAFADVVVGSSNTASVMYMPGNNMGSFMTGGLPRNINNPALAMLTAPFDGSGRPILATIEGNRLETFRFSNGTTLNQLAGVNLNQTARSGAALDLDGDGLPDIMAGGMTALINNGINFNIANNFAISPATPSTVSADFNEDSLPDVAILDPLVDQLIVEVMASPLQPPLFNQSLRMPIIKTAFMMVVADFNLDGHLDIAVTHRTTNEIGIYLGDGKGRFAPTLPVQACTVNTTPGVYGLVVGDWNLDTRPDLAATCEGSDQVSVIFHL